MATGPPDREPRVCDAALAHAFRFLGKRWSGVLLGVLVSGPAGFAELRRALPGINDSVLSERLTELTAAGLIDRTVHEGPPVSVAYALTPVGRELSPALAALTSWAARHLMDPAAGCPGRD